jgi:hypothetical protein
VASTIIASLRTLVIPPSFKYRRTSSQEALGGSLFNAALFTDEFRMDGHPSFSPDSQAVQSQHDASLLHGQDATLVHVIVNEHISLHSEIADGETAIGSNRTVGIPGFDVRRDFASQGSDGAISDLEILDLEELSLQSFETSPRLGRLGEGFIRPRLFAGVTPVFGQSENQNNQSSLQHNLSLGSLTLPPEPKPVKRSDIFRTLLLTHRTPHPFTFHLSRLTFHDSWFDSPQTICYAPRRFRACHDELDLPP